ncbi:CPBP family intramembrane glutamic endopeptidase [Okibacterium fritillariae]|uniref:Membrane protease YdiL, CAAX protease family n=1 Tax=Okibacterium fritillariae TaxID=123320 RepID=A0A1T5IBX6_9MICO|nr:CPBP family intramembrane glutamic endopeptidase [Okibacterium fritillariae]SKC36686.1 Membrane protease YdiL, CAAX protease family [Okibacterium fritillariae]
MTNHTPNNGWVETAPRPVVTHDQGLRVKPQWWRGTLAIVALVVLFFVLSTILSLAGVFFDVATGQYTFDEWAENPLRLTPAVMLANNLALGAMWPVSMLLQWLLFGVRPGNLSSVTGRFRWRWMGRLALVIVPVWLIYVAISFIGTPPDELQFTASTISMLVIVLLTTPLQSAGEEYGARGLIQRSVGSWFGHPTAAFVSATFISSFVFMLAHAASDPWLLAYYFVFGVSMALAARGTGGLEAPVLIHATNNVLLFIPTALLDQTDQVFEREAGVADAWMLIPMAIVLAAGLFSVWWGRRYGLVTRAPLPRSSYEKRPQPPQYSQPWPPQTNASQPGYPQSWPQSYPPSSQGSGESAPPESYPGRPDQRG